MAITTAVRTEQGSELTELWSLEHDISSCSVLSTNSAIEDVGIACFVAWDLFLPTDMDTQVVGDLRLFKYAIQGNVVVSLTCFVSNSSNTCLISNSFALS